MQRDIYAELVRWKDSPRRKPLVLRGARQVGKTYILREFGDREYEQVAYFDFEADPDLDDFFAKRLDPRRIIRDLSLYLGWDILPQRHLVVFDEIQASNHALNSLKYFQQDANEYHIATAGSLLGVKLSKPRSFPVGKVNFLDLHPLAFLEFLDAVGKSSLRTLIEETIEFAPYPAAFHHELIEVLRSYYFVGGMPEAVCYFAETEDLDEVRRVQREIIDSFVLDFSKHAEPSEIPKLSLIWESIPVQLARENKKFVFSAIKRSARARGYENALQWLDDAGLVCRSYRVSTAKCPLKGYADRSAFKVFLLDVGILGAMGNISPQILVKGNQLFDEYGGAFVENYVAQQLQATGRSELYYWQSESRKAEVDFLCEFGGAIHPLEAKAGVNPKSKSLKSYDGRFSPPVLSRTTLLNLKRDGKICNYPLYAVVLFPGLSQMK